MIILRYRIKGVNESWKEVSCNSREDAIAKSLELQFSQSYELEFEMD